MSEIHLSEDQKKALKIDEMEFKKKLDLELAAWVAEKGWAVVPVLHYTNRGIQVALDFVKLTDEQIADIKKRL